MIKKSKNNEKKSKINNSEANQLNIDKNIFEKVLVKKYCDANEVLIHQKISFIFFFKGVFKIRRNIK